MTKDGDGDRMAQRVREGGKRGRGEEREGKKKRNYELILSYSRALVIREEQLLCSELHPQSSSKQHLIS